MRCAASRATVKRSGLGEIAGYGRDASHHCFYWGAKLMLITTAEGAVCAFSLANPKELDERKQALHLLHVRPSAPGPTPIVCDKGFAGAGIERAAADLGHPLIRPARLTTRPLAYPAFLTLAEQPVLLLSDSGGIQEEASVLGIPLIVLRHSTERLGALTSRCILTALVSDTSPGATSPFDDDRAFARIADLVELAARGWKALLETVCVTR